MQKNAQEISKSPDFYSDFKLISRAKEGKLNPQSLLSDRLELILAAAPAESSQAPAQG